MGGGPVSTWRVGESMRNVVFKNGVAAGWLDTPELAAEVVAALNGRQPYEEPAVEDWEIRQEGGRERSPDECPTCGDFVRPAKYDTAGRHPRQYDLCPGRGPKPPPDTSWVTT